MGTGNLGIKRKDLFGGSSPISAPAPDERDNELVYPSMSFEAKQAEAAGLSEMEFGQTFTFTGRARVTRVGGYSESNPKPEISITVEDISDVTPGGDVDEAEEEVDPEKGKVEKALGYTPPAKKPKISVKDTSLGKNSK